MKWNFLDVEYASGLAALCENLTVTFIFMSHSTDNRPAVLGMDIRGPLLI